MRATIGLAAGGEAGTSHSQLVLLHGWWLVRAVWRLVVPKKSWWGASGGGARAEPERGGSLFLRRPPPQKKICRQLPTAKTSEITPGIFTNAFNSQINVSTLITECAQYKNGRLKRKVRVAFG